MKSLIQLFFLSLLSFATFANSGKLNFKFKATTNVPGVKINGELKEVKTFSLESGAKVVIPAAELDTGLAMRDTHMRKDIFNEKDVEITVKSVEDCLKQTKCKIPITIKIQDAMKDYDLVASTENKKNYSGNLELKLSDFNIPQPSKMGVKVRDAIDIEFNVEVLDKK